MIIVSNPKHILFIGDPGNLSKDITKEEAIEYFSNTTILNSMCSFLGITDREYAFFVEEENGSTLISLRAYQRGTSLSDSLFNFGTNYVELSLYGPDELSHINYVCFFHDNSNTYNGGEALTYSQAAESANIDLDDILYCTVHYYPDINDGYLAPCFKFFVDSGKKDDNENTLVNSIIVPMYTLGLSEAFQNTAVNE